MKALPTLKGRWFTVGLCIDCWDRCNPDRKMAPERRAETEAAIAHDAKGFDKDDLAMNRCPVCDENLNAGIYVRVTSVTLRKMREGL